MADGLVFVLRDRIVTAEHPTSPCEQLLTIRAPAGNVCGVIHVPHTVDAAGACDYAPAYIGPDGTIVDTNTGGSCHVRWWSKALGVRGR